MTDDTNDGLKALVAEVAAAYFSNSHVNVADIGSVIEQIAKSLESVGTGAEGVPIDDVPAQRRLTPAQIRKSITPEALISFEDGRRYKTMRRHLSVKGLTPEEYRQKWGLPSDYPMVSASYSAARSQMARALGLGNKGGHRAGAPPATARRGRGRASAKGE
jgi:predicted transcriptional regulator